MNDDPNMTQTRICELTGVSECTQYHIAALLHETGEVVCTPLVAGHPQKLDVLDSAASVHGNLGEELTHYVAVS